MTLCWTTGHPQSKSASEEISLEQVVERLQDNICHPKTGAHRETDVALHIEPEIILTKELVARRFSMRSCAATTRQQCHVRRRRSRLTDEASWYSSACVSCCDCEEASEAEAASASRRNATDVAWRWERLSDNHETQVYRSTVRRPHATETRCASGAHRQKRHAERLQP